MKINIKNLTKLANIQLDEQQEEKLKNSIPTVVGHMDEIKNLDIDEIPETTRVTEEVNVWREDLVEPSLSQKEALRNAKKTQNGFFVVSAIFEE